MFDSNFIQRLEYLSLLSRRMFRGQLLAQKRTMQSGSGIEFADHREYHQGDDLRYLDWNVYARHGDLLLKRFQEEEDLHVYLLLDTSPSMDRSDADECRKLDLARQIAAALAYIALSDLDRVSVLTFDGQIRHVHPLTRGKDHIVTLLRFLGSLQCQGDQTDLKAVASDFVRRTPQTGLAIVISDLFDPAGFEHGLDQLRHARFEPHLIQVHTQQEANPDFLGDTALVDCESRLERQVTVTEQSLTDYKRLFDNFVGAVEDYCRTYGISHTRTTTEVPFDVVLLKMMRAAAVG